MKNDKLSKWVKNYDVGTITLAILFMGLALGSWNLHKESNSILELLAFPFSLVGLGLRNLSLTGSFGNGISWVIFIVLGALPFGFAYNLNKKDKKTSSIGLLVIIGLFSYGLLYANINPGVLSAMQPSTVPASLGQVHVILIILAMIFYYLVFAFMITLTLDAIETKEIVSNLARLLLLVILLTLISLFYLGFHDMISGFQRSDEFGSMIYATQSAGDNFMAILKFIMVLIPGLFFLRTGKAALSFLVQLNQDTHSLESALMAKQVGDYAKTTVIAYLISTLIFVFFQLIMSPTLTNVNIVLSLPILELFLSFFMVLLSRLFLESSALKKENEMFI